MDMDYPQMDNELHALNYPIIRIIQIKTKTKILEIAQYPVSIMDIMDNYLLSIEVKSALSLIIRNDVITNYLNGYSHDPFSRRPAA